MRRSVPARALLLLLALLPAAASGGDLRFLFAGRRGLLVDRPGTARDRLRLRVARDPALAPLPSPLCPAGSAVELAALDGLWIARAPEIPLPCTGWRRVAGGYAFRSATGPVRRILLSERALAIAMQGEGPGAFERPLGFVQVDLRVGPVRLRTRLQDLRQRGSSAVSARRVGRAAGAGEAAFWDTLFGVADRGDEALGLLADAVGRNPADGRSWFLLGMMHFYRFGQLVTSPPQAGPVARAEVAAARDALETASALLFRDGEGDNRIPGFAAAAVYQYGVAHGDPGEVARGLGLLEDAVALNPFFNSFDLFSAAGVVLPDDPVYRRIVGLVDDTFAGGSANGASASCVVSQPEICGNAGMAPHNAEGALVLFGDIYAKAGRSEDARGLYQLAAALGGASGWRFQESVLQRLSDLDARVARYQNGDLADDPPLFGSGAEACVGCHGR